MKVCFEKEKNNCRFSRNTHVVLFRGLKPSYTPRHSIRLIGDTLSVRSSRHDEDLNADWLEVAVRWEVGLVELVLGMLQMVGQQNEA